MRRNSRRAGLVAAVVVAGGVVTGGMAHADTPAGVADLGEASFTKGATTVTVPTLAPCAVEGPTSASAESVTKPGLTFGGGTSSCTTTVVDPDNDTTTTKSTATGKNFELSALVSAGGPRIRLASYTVTCDAAQRQTNANWTFSGLAGITGLPSPMPANYTKPITKANGTVLANAVFNTQTLPGDGSISLTMLRIDFAPASGITGAVTVGRTSCSPV
ncbi:hypothetical protein [Amycolatopsis sp. FDAARGOS 1241]|uniref:hypothetical protein n=1 Tax=Amycolatopsis sp. FDAARGOS 1241 TaxID=2778070 RepID=UPI0019526FA5|nr:hypothetical protein [Amycolatopsis sp. FDAARGOS 1241]QRP45466.1 hypothetical protein I6J71_41095 [Amycolatopsis sp. FDAARGOS 1241]